MIICKRRPMVISKRLSCISNVRYSVCKRIPCIIRLSCVSRVSICKWCLECERLLTIRWIPSIIRKWCLECERLLCIRWIPCTIRKWLLNNRRRLYINGHLSVFDSRLLSLTYWHFRLFLLY